ncbi:hypothetical protein BaRGS_00016962 [Batillaria attramentaria]|uniref:Uncharacterized protein n=1 Tax=Batillaria attramentaria TaxID=370345 RepID=A0ABD0KXE6_9CAEN
MNRYITASIYFPSYINSTCLQCTLSVLRCRQTRTQDARVREIRSNFESVNDSKKFISLTAELERFCLGHSVEKKSSELCDAFDEKELEIGKVVDCSGDKG